MSETTPERAALLLADARRFAGIKSATWPPELPPGQLAALIAGGYKGDKKADYDKWRNRLRFAIESAPPLLAVRTERKPPGSPWMLGKVPKPWGRDAFGCVTFAESKALERHFIAPAAAAAWLDAIGETLTEHVRAWLGDERREEAQEAIKAAPAATPAPIETTKERRIAAIVATACNLGYEPKRIAWGGKAAIKAECLKDAKLFTDSTFDAAWKAAVKAEQIKVENWETYTKR
jgi:hypothetical protein